MVLPVPLIMQACQMMAASYAAGRRDTAAAEQAKLQAQIRSLEIAAEREKVQAQKEILIHAMNAAQHMFDRKMDFFVEAHRRFQDMIDQHQAALLDEKRLLQERQFDDGLSDAQFAQVIQRQQQVNVELIDLKKVSAYLNKEFSGIIQELSAQMPTLALPSA